MAERTMVDLIEDWQTGAALVLLVAIAGVASAFALPLEPPYGPILGFLGGAVLAFLALSYLLYGR